MSGFRLMTTSAQKTRNVGRQAARCLRAGDILCFFGDLGSGKTTLIKGLAQGLGIAPDQVSSPTFVLMNIYDQAALPVYHFDLYRLENSDQLYDLGYDEFLYGNGVAVIEWSEHFGPLLPAERLDVVLTHKGEDRREICLTPHGDRGCDLYDRICQEVSPQ
ncbi:MAG: tRNA (adenosine(37)-N6)-threonylcarbamoyltransferase complex ATPase subunit type 1 TsaE [Candidatus Omnitrophota bacterium]